MVFFLPIGGWTMPPTDPTFYREPMPGAVLTFGAEVRRGYLGLSRARGAGVNGGWVMVNGWLN